MSSKKPKKMRIRSNSGSKPPSPVVDKINSIPTVAFAAKSKNKFKIIMEQMEKDKNITLKERFDVFLSETSFTALIKIFKAGNIIKQIVWLILVLVMMAWLCVQCYWLFEKYYSYPTQIKIDLVPKQKMEFPSVTICNRNPIRMSQLGNSPFNAVREKFTVRQDSSLYDQAVNMMQNRTDEGRWSGVTGPGEELSIMTQMKNQSFNVWSALDDANTAKNFYQSYNQEMTATFAYADISSRIDHSELKTYGHQIEDLLTSCIFNGMQCSPENFTYVHNVKYGNCFTYNAFNNSQPPLYTTYSGPMMGLTLELNIQQREYISALAPDAGVRVLIHSRGSFPALEDDGFSVPVGFVTSVGIKLTEVTRLPPPHGNCAEEGLIDNLYMKRYGVNYEKSTCMKSCQQYIWKERCGCVVALFEIPDNTSACKCDSPESQQCLWNVSEAMQECEINCPTPCFEKKYEPLISMAKWPSDDYASFLDFKVMHTSLDFMGPDHNKPSSDDNLAKIEVYFRDMMYESIEQQKSYESENLISDIGGQLGLWLGLSAITLGEIMELVMAVFKAAFRRRHRETSIESLEGYGRRLSIKEYT